MSKKWYGSIDNRIEEGKQFVNEIKVGDGVTEYLWSDRKAYEVVDVKDQKHITIREYDHKLKGEAFSNNWELISNDDNAKINLVKRGNDWYIEKVATIEQAESRDAKTRLWVVMNGFDIDKIRKNGSQKKYQKMNISIGVADYYYDYEF